MLEESAVILVYGFSWTKGSLERTDKILKVVFEWAKVFVFFSCRE